MSLSVPKLARPLPLHHHSSYGSLTMSFHTFTPFLGSTHKLRFISPIKLNAPRSNSTVVSVSNLVKNNKPKSTTNLVPSSLFSFFHINDLSLSTSNLFGRFVYFFSMTWILHNGFLRINFFLNNLTFLLIQPTQLVDE